MERHLARQADDPSDSGAGRIGLYGRQVASLSVLLECVSSNFFDDIERHVASPDDMERQIVVLSTPSHILGVSQ